MPTSMRMQEYSELVHAPFVWECETIPSSRNGSRSLRAEPRLCPKTAAGTRPACRTREEPKEIPQRPDVRRYAKPGSTRSARLPLIGGADEVRHLEAPFKH